jgi:hypothetical protein
MREYLQITARTSLSIATLLFVAPLTPLAAQAPVVDEKRDARSDLIGTWEGASEDVEGEKIEIREDGTGRLDGERIRWSILRAGVLRYTLDGENEDVEFRLTGDRLDLEIDGDVYSYKRVSRPSPPPKTPKPSPGAGSDPAAGSDPTSPKPFPGAGFDPGAGSDPGANPLGAKRGKPNPLAAKKADPFVRTFRGETVTLVLESAGEKSAYRGKLIVGETEYPARASVDGDALQGIFEAGGEEYRFSAKLDGDVLTLESDGNQHRLEAAPLANAAEPIAPDLSRGYRVPAKVEGVFEGATKKVEHPRGWYSFELPDAWSIGQETEDGLVIQPGFREGDTLDAVILLVHGELEEDERNVEPHILIDRLGPEFRRDLAAQGIEIEDPKEKSKAVLVGDVPGAEQEWKAKAGDKSLTIWIGGIVKREYYLATIAIVLDSRVSDFVPGAKRIFRSLVPKPPERNTALEKALAGLSFSKSRDPGERGSFFSSYYFRPEGQVKKELLASGTVGLSLDVGASSEELGRYEIVGDTVFLYFRDGQVSGTVEHADGRVTGLVVGGERFRAR